MWTADLERMTIEDVVKACTGLKAGSIVDVTWSGGPDTAVEISRATVTTKITLRRRHASMPYVTVLCRPLSEPEAEDTAARIPSLDSGVFYHAITVVSGEGPRRMAEFPDLHVKKQGIAMDATDNDKEFTATLKEIDLPFRVRFVVNIRSILAGYVGASKDVKEFILMQMQSAVKILLRTTPPKRYREMRPSTEGATMPRQAVNHIVLRAKRLARMGELGRASRALDTVQRQSDLTAAEVLAKLQTLHPDGEAAPPPPGKRTPVAMIAEDELIRAAKAMCSGACPGPSGMSDEMVMFLVADPVCCLALRHILTDIVNGEVCEEYRTRLVRSLLVSLPKPDGGVRPIAIGETLLKLANKIITNRLSKEIAAHFAGLQYGCMSAGGAEIVAHNVREDVRTGKCVMTIDQSNAFNTPFRAAIAEALYALPVLNSLWPLFYLEYGAASELLYAKNGSLEGIILSKAGARQGSLSGGLYFNIVLHPILRQMREMFPAVRVYAYMDDVTLTCDDPAEMERFFPIFEAKCNAVGLKFNYRKCEFLGNGKAMPQALRELGVIEVLDCIKVVGAYIGQEEAVCGKLLKKLEKHDVFFARLLEMGPGTEAYALLTKCLVPRQGFVTRVQTPSECHQVCLAFDERVDEVLTAWFGIDVHDDRTRLIMELPWKHGGSGVRWSTEGREVAYRASSFSSLEACGRSAGSAPPTQRQAAQVKHILTVKLLSQDPVVRRHLDECAKPGASRWLTACGAFIPSPLYAASFRMRVLAQHGETRGPWACSCDQRKLFEKIEDFQRHITGCAKVQGANCTRKHNACVRLLADMCAAAGLPVEVEPRGFQSYQCPRCGAADLDGPEAKKHRLQCKGDLIRSGPDFKVYWGGSNSAFTEEVYYDLTICHTTSASYADMSTEEVFAAAVDRKTAKYVTSGMIASDSFCVLPVTAMGYLGKAVTDLLKDVAKAMWEDLSNLQNRIAALVQLGNGATLKAASV
jgi:hypothetical protein